MQQVTLFASKEIKGFCDPAIHAIIPADAVEITKNERDELLAGESAGRVIGWDEAGYPFLADPSPPTAAQITAALTASIQAHMDSQARACGYDDIKSAVTYAAEPAVSQFQAEGLVFREWRSLCWAHCYAVLDAVNLGERAITTAEELIAELPALVLPS